MPRSPNVIPSIKLHTSLPEDLHAKLTLHLFSDLEGRVPACAYQEFFCERIREYFEHKHLDLAPYIPGMGAGNCVVSGAPVSIEMLKHILDRSTV